MRYIKIIIPIAFLLTFSLTLYIGSHVIAQVNSDCQSETPISTIPDDPNPLPRPCNCSGVSPTLISSGTTIAPGGSITLWIDSGGLACPYYQWSVSGTGYSLDNSTTSNDLEVGPGGRP